MYLLAICLKDGSFLMGFDKQGNEVTTEKIHWAYLFGNQWEARKFAKFNGIKNYTLVCKYFDAKK